MVTELPPIGNNNKLVVPTNTAVTMVTEETVIGS